MEKVMGPVRGVGLHEDAACRGHGARQKSSPQRPCALRKTPSLAIGGSAHRTPITSRTGNTVFSCGEDPASGGGSRFVRPRPAALAFPQAQSRCHRGGRRAGGERRIRSTLECNGLGAQAREWMNAAGTRSGIRRTGRMGTSPRLPPGRWGKPHAARGGAKEERSRRSVAAPGRASASRWRRPRRRPRARSRG
jgi:hypothetical protein